MKWFQIPLMSISREDIISVYEKHHKLSHEESLEKGNALTDIQMEHIADEFSEEFFAVHEGLFLELLIAAVSEVEEYEREQKSIG